MSTILIVEGHSPALVEAAIARGDTGLAQIFAGALWAIDPDLTIRTAAPYAGETLELDGVDGVVFTGSGVEWSTEDTRTAPLHTAMALALKSGLPVHGSCYGMQLAASVLGGKVGASPNGCEDGLACDIRLTDAGRAHPMMAGRRDGFAVPCVHRDEVLDLPVDAVLLASNAHSRVQAFAYSAHGADFWGCQYHPEYSPTFVADGLDRFRPGSEGVTKDLRAAATDDTAAARFGTNVAELSLPGRDIELRNWLAHVAVRSESVAA